MGGAHHCSGPPVSEMMTYTVSSGTLNPSILQGGPAKVKPLAGSVVSW